MLIMFLGEVIVMRLIFILLVTIVKIVNFKKCCSVGLFV